jgi:hypothetical protein
MDTKTGTFWLHSSKFQALEEIHRQIYKLQVDLTSLLLLKKKGIRVKKLLSLLAIHRVQGLILSGKTVYPNPGFFRGFPQPFKTHTGIVNFKIYLNVFLPYPSHSQFTVILKSDDVFEKVVI